jgi:hypothetical protein
MRRHIKWLLNEIDLWVGEGIIEPQQGQAIKTRYPAPAEGPAWGRIIFFSIGAILFGLGVILLFAYNWQRMHKFVKLAVIFTAIIAAHGAGFWLRRPNSSHQTAGEGLHLMGTMLFGAGIWLIAQVYHIEEHYPNAFLFWGFGALAMAWSLPSTAHGILAVILFVLWNCFEAKPAPHISVSHFRRHHAAGLAQAVPGAGHRLPHRLSGNAFGFRFDARRRSGGSGCFLLRLHADCNEPGGAAAQPVSGNGPGVFFHRFFCLFGNSIRFKLPPSGQGNLVG